LYFICANIKNVTCINFGLGSLEQIGKQTLNIVSLDGGGSTLHTNNNNILQYNQIFSNLQSLNSLQIDHQLINTDFNIMLKYC
jgi:hypothetical protein